MQRCDVLIVGGGPAGSTCATALSRRGFDVVVADKADFPRDKVCAGWITPAVVDELAIDLADYGRGRTLEPITSFVVGRMGDRTHLHSYRQPVSYGIRRCELDDYLLRRSGARLALGHRIKDMVRGDAGSGRGQLDDRRWIVDGEFEARILVGAGGHFCPVARAFAAEPDAARVAAEECEFEIDDCAVEPGIPELYFTRDLAGYGWAFRKGKFLNVGLGVRVTSRGSDSQGLPRSDAQASIRGDACASTLRSRIDKFVEFLVERGRIPRAPRVKMSGHAYLLCPDSRRQRLGDGFVLIGDAAGLAYDRSGEGIRCAAESGMLAARTITDALLGGGWSASDLAPYEEAIEQRFGAPRGESWDPVDLVPATLRRTLAAALMTSSWFSRRVLLEKWFLHADQPALPAMSADFALARAGGA